jgi:hypothetical protein
MEKSPTELLVELADELQELAIKLARERKIIAAEQEIDVLLRIKPIPKRSPFDLNDWDFILSLQWSPKQRAVLEKLREGPLRAKQIAEMINKRKYNFAWHTVINRKLKAAGMKHRLWRQRTQYATGKLAQDAFISMRLVKD